MDPDKRYSSIDKLMKAIQGKLYGIPWLPPGMRSLHPAKMVASGIGYAFWAWLSAGLHVDGANARVLLANRIIFFLCGLFIKNHYDRMERRDPHSVPYGQIDNEYM